MFVASLVLGAALRIPLRGEEASPLPDEFPQNFSRCLKVADEPSSLAPRMKNLKTDEAVFRLVVDLQIDGLYVITCEMSRKSSRLRWKHISVGLPTPRDIYAVPKKVKDAGMKKMTDNQTRTLMGLFYSGSFFERPAMFAADPTPTLDGIGVVVEGVDKERHKLIFRSFPAVRPVGERVREKQEVAEGTVFGEIMYIIGLPGTEIRLF